MTIAALFLCCVLSLKLSLDLSLVAVYLRLLGRGSWAADQLGQDQGLEGGLGKEWRHLKLLAKVL